MVTGESDGLFDLMDLFNTSLVPGGVDPAVLPADKFCDGTDQTCFLLIDDGQSKRELVCNWLGVQLAAIRMREYKAHLLAGLPQEKSLRVDMAAVVLPGLAPWLFNLLVDPTEEYPVAFRLNARTASPGAALSALAATFVSYQPRDPGS